MKQTIEVVNELNRYFGATVIGSYLFVESGLLSEDDTNDIDIAVVQSFETTNRMIKFLEDKGFIAEDVEGFEYPGNLYSRKILVRTKFTNPEYDKVIDINYFKQIPQVYSIPDLIASKFKAGRSGDLKQLSMVLFNKGGNSLKSIKNLQDFYNDNSQINNQD